MLSESGDIPVLLVTGASRGIGRAIAVRGAAAGFSVAINYVRDDAAARETLGRCVDARARENQHFHCLRADVSDEHERAALFAETRAAFGRLDALVCNAGAAPRSRVDVTETSAASFREVLALNLEAPFFLAQSAAKYWLSDEAPAVPHGNRSIISISSVSAELVSLNRSEYCISKAGLAMAMQAWALRLAPHGIGVYELRPGIIRTDMTDPVRDIYERRIEEGLVPQHRWGEPEDVARVCAAIWRGDMGFSTGSVIHVDGGLHLGRL